MPVPGMAQRGTGNPIITQGGAGTYDATKVGPCAVLKMGPSDYRMWYEAVKDDANLTTTVAYATSSDGTTWSKYGSNPVMSPDVAWEAFEVSPGTVLWDSAAGLFKMWYHGAATAGAGTRKIGYATSSDGLSWSKDAGNPVLTVGTGGAWDDSAVTDVKVIRVSSTDYRMWYRGHDGSSPNVCKIGYATSSDGITWSKSGSNPIFSPGSSGQWDDGLMYCFTPFMRSNNDWHAWYIADGTPGGGLPIYLGYAYSTDGISWTRGAYNPILAAVGTTDVVTDSVWVYLDGDTANAVPVYRIVYGSYDTTSTTLRRKAECFVVAETPDPSGRLLDDFNRADDATPPPGSNWTNGVTTFVAGEGLAIVSNQLTRKSTGGYRQGGYWNVQNFGPDVCVIVDVSANASTSGFEGIALYARLQQEGSSTVDGYWLDYDWSSKVMSLLKMTNAAGTTIDSKDATVTLAAGDKVALTCIGTRISGWYKPSGGSWVRMLSAIDSTYTSAGKIGIEVFDSQNIKLDNLLIGPVSTALTMGRRSPLRNQLQRT